MSRHSQFDFLAAAALSALLCLPMSAQAASQSSNSSAAAQPAAQANAAATATVPAPSSDQSDQAQPAQARPPLQAPVRQGFWGRLNPFARKKYVESQISPIRDRVNELNGLSASNAKSISDLDAEAKAGIAKANGTARQAADTADQAQQQVQQTATEANQLNQQVDSVNTKLQSVDQYQVAQSADLHFKPGPARLNPDTQQQLSSFLQGLSGQKGYIVEVTAYSSRRGNAGLTASQDLADAVVRYLVLEQNIPLYRIYTMGLGTGSPTMATTQMNASARTRRTIGGTVQIKILKNSLAEATANANPQE